MNSHVRLVCAALVAAFAVGVATPQPAEARRKGAVVTIKTAQAFKAADTDQSRQLDQAEWATAGYNPASFALVDRNASGTVGFFEALAAVLASLKAKAGGR